MTATQQGKSIKMLAMSLVVATAVMAMSVSAAPKEPQDDINVPEFVQDVIEKHPVVIFSKSYCPFCRKTKATIAKYSHADPMILELDQSNHGAEMQDELQKITGRRTVPRVFIGGKSVGGNDEVEKLHQSGKLSTLLADAGIVSAHDDL
eukprot:gb/GECG01013992.1/.p1 GENE.gb/GECG01013992.1/~~gb/GECG01013992.1/.p1  ORF type:complete len:149 (+),score=18.75 gb/GECG01013992.1/:1-447(+)